MINVSNLKKTYFKGKANEIKVINDTTLALPSTGLISFLGQSGSGKTTLLNTIGGLDKADSGIISYNDLELKKYKMNKVDTYRAKHFGYVFQNYLLLEDLSVYDNLKLALSLIDITDKEEVNKRIEYSLKAVGLYKYRKKMAGALSGGQMQRVSIARCLVKKCSVIIADEPTGNLDSENTIEVMNILKKVSKEALVLLVTHNKEIAYFYSDKIVNLKDGMVSSYEDNISSGSLDSANDRKIFLLDLNNKNLSSDKINVNLYADSESDIQDLTVVIKNNTVYIESKSRLQIVSGGNVELVNDHYKKLEVHELDSFNYDTSWYKDITHKYTIGEFFRSIGLSFKEFFESKRKKIFNFVFVLIGIIMAVLVLLQTNYSTVDASSYNNEPDQSVLYWDKGDFFSSMVNSSDMAKCVEADVVTDRYSTFRYVLHMSLNSTREIEIVRITRSFPIEKLGNTELLYGKKPTKASEIVIGKKEADILLEESKASLKYENLIGATTNEGFTIVGIANVKTNSVYLYKSSYLYYGYSYDNPHPFGYYDKVKNELLDFSITKGNAEFGTRSLIARDDLGLDVGNYIFYDTLEYKIIGLYHTNTETSNYYLLTNDLDMCYKTLDKTGIHSEQFGSENDMRFFDNEMFEYEILEGRDIKDIHECLVSIYSPYKVGQVIKDEKVVGKFYPKNYTFEYTSNSFVDTEYTNNVVIVNRKTLLIQAVKDNARDSSFTYAVTSEDEARGIIGPVYVKNYLDFSIEKDKTESQSKKTIYPIIEAILLAIIIVYTYFSQRAKMISEVYEIGVLRSLGAKKKRLLGKCLRDNFVKTTLTTLLGYLGTVLIYYLIAAELNSIAETTLLSFNPLYMLLGIVIIYATQLFIGCLPMIMLLRHTPSEINSKYDI